MEMNPIIQGNVTNWSAACWSSARAALWGAAGGGVGGGVTERRKVRPYLKHSISHLSLKKTNTHTHTERVCVCVEHWFICLFKLDLYLLIHSPLLKEQLQPQTSGVARKRLSEAAFISLYCIKLRPLSLPLIMQFDCRLVFLQQLLHFDNIQLKSFCTVFDT